MRTYFMLALVLCCTLVAHAQIDEIPLPLVDTLDFRITKRVYMAINGTDVADGTRMRPKKTFAAAMAAIEWPTTGAVYAEIVLLPGTYRDRFVQGPADYIKGSATRNVSIRGEGRVVLDGKGIALNGVEGVVTLRGSHIRIRNIHVVSSPVSGIAAIGPMTDVLIDSSSVDTCISHGLLFDHVDRGAITNSSVREAAASMLGEPVRAFGSAIKLFLSRNLTVRHCISQRNWGEGVNVNRTERCLVEDCLVGDNYGIAFYLDMAAVCVIRNNRIYYDPTDKSHWGGDRAPSGVSLSNELTCYANSQCDAIWTGTDNCNYHCQGFGCEYWVRMNDSCFIYNNLIVNAGSGIEMFELFNIDCFRTIEFTHNTVVGSSRSGSGAMLWFNLAMLVRYIENIKVQNNLFLIDDESARKGTPMCRFGDNPATPVVNNISFVANSWNRKADCGLNTASDNVIEHPIARFDTTMIATLDPRIVGDVYGLGSPVPYVTTDFYGRPRRNPASVGAMEGGGAAGVEPPFERIWVRVSPNPAQDQATISVSAPSVISILDITGHALRRIEADTPVRVDLAAFPTGVYAIQVVQGPYTQVLSLCIVR